MDGQGGSAPGGPAPGSTGSSSPQGPAALSRQARNRLRTRQRILDAAVKVITRKGYEGTTVQDIADAADIALRTFYNYFDSKADVATAWFHDWSDDLAASVDAQPEDCTPAELLAGVLATLAAKGYPGRTTWSDQQGRPIVPPQAAALLGVPDPAFSGLVHRRLVFGFQRLASLFRSRLGYADDAWEPYVIAGSVASLWFVAIHGTQDMIDRGVTPPSVHVTVQRAFEAYSQGLDRLWTGRPPPG